MSKWGRHNMSPYVKATRGGKGGGVKKTTDNHHTADVSVPQRRNVTASTRRNMGV